MTDETQPTAPAPTRTSLFSRPKPSKPEKPRAYRAKGVSLSLKLPKELVDLCEREQVAPSDLVRDFIADLCGIPAWTSTSRYGSLGAAAQEAARAYHQAASQARKDKARDKAARDSDETA
ncbi:MAG: hypothetical protein HEQ39_05460 [Rhizobacter sp.]